MNLPHPHNCPAPLTRARHVAFLLFALLLARPAAADPPAQQNTLRFIVMRDIPCYGARSTILNSPVAQAIHTANPPFLVHFGDIKTGEAYCNDHSLITDRDDIYRLLPGRVIYTPGDHEWADCGRANRKTPLSELDRLDRIRRLFYNTPPNFPKNWAFARQTHFPENARWINDDILFATVHIKAGDNRRKYTHGVEFERAQAITEAREQANQIWLEQAFGRAMAQNARAIVILVKDDVTRQAGAGLCSGAPRIGCDSFLRFRSRLKRLAANFHAPFMAKRPVLLVQGDRGAYCWDKKFGGRIAPNLWRLNAWGNFTAPPDATEITVPPRSAAQPFMAKTLINQRSPADQCQ